MKTFILVTLSAGVLITQLPGVAQAQTLTAAQGLEKIKTNVENSKANQREYERNLKVIAKNLDEVNKAKGTFQKQKDTVQFEVGKNSESLKKVVAQEREITTLLTQENEKLQAETKQLAQLEKLVAQIKLNQVQRETNITEYQNQLRMTAEEKKAWKDRDTELRTQEAKTIQSLRAIASEETTWSNKKKGYESESKRWSAEAEKQQRVQDTYQGLANQK